jgi:hypothetical protein
VTLRHSCRKQLAFNKAIYGADVLGSISDPDAKVSMRCVLWCPLTYQLWNINDLGTILDDLSETGVKIPGVNTAYLYFGWTAGMIITWADLSRHVEGRVLLAHGGLRPLLDQLHSLRCPQDMV